MCFDLYGNLEKYSLEIMHESKKIFLVCTPEIPSLHLAREKYLYLKQLDLSDRVSILLNRCQKRPLLSSHQIEELLGLPVETRFDNGDRAQAIHTAAQECGAALIAMSTHGHHGLGRRTFGSVTDHVLKSAEIPVLVLQPHQ